MKNRSVIVWVGTAILALLALAGIFGYKMYNKPHRDVQTAPVDLQVEAGVLISEYLVNAAAANQKYLPEGEQDRILAVSGTVYAIDTDMNGQKVVLLKEREDAPGVSCTFLKSTNVNADKLRVGEKATIKGVIRSGAGYDEDLDLFEDAILEKCDLYEGQQ